jgi:predicted Na+-dependent transporter
LRITKTHIEKLIEIEKKDNVFTHLKTVFTRDLRIIGEVKKNELRIWEQNIWSTVFYPIFIFQFENNILVKQTDKLNPFGKFLISIPISFLIYLISSNIFQNFEKFSLIENWRAIILLGTFFTLCIMVCRYIYRFEKKKTLTEFLDTLEIPYYTPLLENEWSVKNILIRLFTYPFCLFIISICMYAVFVQNNYILGLAGFGFCGYYLVADIKMIISAKKTNDNNVYKK